MALFLCSLRCGTSNGRVAERCATGDGCPHLTTEQGHSMSRRDSIHGDKDRHSSCASAILRLERMPDIILFRDCTLHPLYHSLSIVLDRTITDLFASLRCGTSNGRVAERCATGDGCPHLTTEQGHSMSRRDSIHGDKDRHSSCASAILRLEQMPDIILFRDCTRHPLYHSLIVVLDWTVMDFFASL